MTLLDVLITCTLIGIVSSIAVARSTSLLDAMAVRTAQHEVVALFGYARDAALGTQRATAVHIDAEEGALTVAQGADTLIALHLGDRGVGVTATRDSMAYTPNGLGYGAANLRVALARGHAADTIVVSRLGRVDRR